MDSSNKAIWAILTVPLLVIVSAMGCSGKNEKMKFDRLRVGMTLPEVQKIMEPALRRKYLQVEGEGDDDGELSYNDNVVLIIRNGRLAQKKWIEKK